MQSRIPKTGEQQRSAATTPANEKVRGKAPSSFVNNRPEAIAQKKLQVMADAGSATLMQIQQPAQLLKFSRFQGLGILTNWFHNAEEERILEKEKKLKEFIREMQPYKNTPEGADIATINQTFLGIEASTISADDYERISARLVSLHERLDRISTIIARKGIAYDQAHAGETAGWIDGAYGGASAVRLVGLVTETYSLLPAPFQTDENKHAIKDAIFGELRLAGAIRNTDATPLALEFAKKRVALLRKNFKKMHERIVADWGVISNTFNLTGGLSFIHLTGSDFHNDGQSVAIIETTTGRKAVYKPRSISPDTQLTAGGNSAFHSLNQDHNAGLNTADYLSRTDAGRNNEAYGYMQFLPKVNAITDAEAQAYYRKMGRLVVSTKLLGVTDLHQENILTAANGEPYIIDAETSFLPDIMLSDAWTATGIKDALRSFTKEGNLTVNNFYTDLELNEWQAIDGNAGTTPDAGFITQKRVTSIQPGGAYRADLVAGIDHVLNFVAANRVAIIQSLQQRVLNVHNVRLVPLATTDFSGAMEGYSRTTDQRDERLTDLTTRIRDSLEQKGYVLLGNFNTIVKAGLKADFDNTDLPIFHFEPSANQVLYRGAVIGRHGTAINEAINANVTNISQAANADVLLSLNL